MQVNAFPPSPWSLRGQLYLSVFRVGRGLRGPQLVGVAFVDYQPDGVLGYAELLCARPTRIGLVPGVTIIDIWVDSPASREGGRALWAIPKELADFSLQTDERFRAEAKRAAGPIGAAEFLTGRALPGRLPFRFRTAQQRGASEVVVTPVRGTARVRRARARWDFDADGPLGRLRDRRPVLSVVLQDFALTFG